MTSIVLIRHAATEWSGHRYLGRMDLPLSTAGREAARIMAGEVAASTPAEVRIISSPSLRTRETAAAVAEAVGRGTAVAVEPDARWAEVDVGEVEGLTFEEAEERFPLLARQLAAAETEIDRPSGETASAFQARIAAAWTDVVAAGRPTSSFCTRVPSVSRWRWRRTYRIGDRVLRAAPGAPPRGRRLTSGLIRQSRTPPPRAAWHHPRSSPRRRWPA